MGESMRCVLLCHLNTLVELELAFEASIVSMRFFDIVLCSTVQDTLFEWLNLILLEDKQKFKLGVLMSPKIGLGLYFDRISQKKEQRQLKEQRNEDLRIAEPIRQIAKSVLSPERNDQISGEKERLACHRAVLQSSTTSPNDPKNDDAKG
ncbi:hypothetical protein H5410_056700 [Solanum commersonii]|uniref:Uncharacterized protein n=1 Tax=Solanum commersonii TaxID=4109 RepID=A0A9J5WNV0_SOLCO|nr:hypothetical protein H5410_056700 [Solanum commersonii]